MVGSHVQTQNARYTVKINEQHDSRDKAGWNPEKSTICRRHVAETEDTKCESQKVKHSLSMALSQNGEPNKMSAAQNKAKMENKACERHKAKMKNKAFQRLKTKPKGRTKYVNGKEPKWRTKHLNGTEPKRRTNQWIGNKPTWRTKCRKA